MEDLRTFLSELKTSDVKQTRVALAVRETEADIATVQTVFSELTHNGVLQAKVEVRCPNCDTHHGDYSRRSNIPSERKICFVCEDGFDMGNQSNWEVVYEIADESADFFPKDDRRLQRYLKSEKDISSEFFRKELTRLEDMDSNPQKRGREFDYFMGLLFYQLEGVDVRIQDRTRTGEIDVYVSCHEAPDWLMHRVGKGTIIENKWQQNPVEKSEISKFHAKAEDIPFPCYIAYFVSMSGFSGGEMGALSKLKSYDNPRLVEFCKDDVEEMAAEGTPENKLRERDLV